MNERPQKLNRNMKRKNSLHSVSSKTQSPPPVSETVDYGGTGAAGRPSFFRKMGITGASLALVLALLVAYSAMADDTFLKFNGGIGVTLFSSIGVMATPFPNVVRGIWPPGQPWVIGAVSAVVKANGRIHVEGRGLLLAGGNAIGMNGGQSVFATLICGALPDGPFTVHSTPVSNAVALTADGDFTIDDTLSPTPSPGCNNPVLLIRSATIIGGPWLAAGHSAGH